MSRGNLLLLVVIGNILAFEEIPGLRWILKLILLNQFDKPPALYYSIHAGAPKIHFTKW